MWHSLCLPYIYFVSVVIILLIYPLNISCRYTLKPPRRDASHECTQRTDKNSIELSRNTNSVCSYVYLYLSICFSPLSNSCAFATNTINNRIEIDGCSNMLISDKGKQYIEIIVYFDATVKFLFVYFFI